MHVCTHAHTHAHTHTDMHTHAHAHTCTCTHTHTCMHACMRIHISTSENKIYKNILIICTVSYGETFEILKIMENVTIMIGKMIIDFLIQ